MLTVILGSETWLSNSINNTEIIPDEHIARIEVMVMGDCCFKMHPCQLAR